MSGPKVGDRVRCTIEKNVLVGVVNDKGYTGFTVRIDNCIPATYVWIAATWSVEVIPPPPPPLPEIEGTVVLDVHGAAWQLWNGQWRCGRGYKTTESLLQCWAPLTVIYVPEVTS